MRMILVSAAAAALVGLASPALASGSSGSGSGAGAGSFGGAGNSQQSRELQRLFRRGRSQVREHITCKECEFHRRLNRNTAVEVAQNVVNGKYDIKEEDRTAVLVYLRDRYNL